MELSKVQLQTYETFGMLVLPGFLKPDHVQALRESVTAIKTKESGEPDTVKHTGRIVGMFHKAPLMMELFDDPRLHGFCDQLLKDPGAVRFLGDEYASFSAPADWHKDMRDEEEFESLKFAFYLDDLSRGGCLRVVPGSHHSPLSRSIELLRAAGDPAPDLAFAHPCLVQPGDLLIFNLKLWHQGTANPPGTHRRVIFWSVGQRHNVFHDWAHKFHDRVGRGKPEEPWPEVMLRDAPARRLRMLDVYEAGTAKGAALAAASKG